MSVHYRLALLGLVAGLIACAALYLAWTARRRAATDRHDREGRDADLLAALKALEKGNRALDRDLDTLVAAFVNAGNPDPFVPTPDAGYEPEPAPPETPTQAAQKPAITAEPRPHPPTPYPRTQAIAAVQAQQSPADIPTEAAPAVERHPGAHRAGGTR